MPRYHVSRSITIDAKPEQVYDTVADFGTWTTWSPWLCCEPDAAVQVTDDPSSVGSVYSWSGTVVGAGEIEHRVLEPGQVIDQEIRFLRPFKAVSQVKFEFQEVGGRTKVTWHMDGSLPIFLFWMKSSMQTFIGMDYERGLRMLKERIETGGIQSTNIIRGIESVGPFRMVGIRQQCSFDECGTAMTAALHQAMDQMQSAGLTPNQEALTAYHATHFKQRQFDFTTGFAIADDIALPNGLSEVRIPLTSAFCVHHRGSYEHLGNAWAAVYKNVYGRKLKTAKKLPTFEIYRNDPDQTDAAELQTDVFAPVR